MEAGVKLREYTGAVLHAKSMIADDRLAVVGSANFDFLSISMNWELSVVIEDPEIVSQLREQHEKDLEQSEEVTLD
ncbi:phospholipase D-like domain-containing protein, partial [bacterium]|nr:phospholipase D-like domain-containing protein [bacterium]